MSLPREARCGKQHKRAEYLSRNSRCCTPSTDCKYSCSRPAIPVTICEHIIDLVAEDHPCCWFQVRRKEVSDTLKACSLVARSWAPRSQYHLFRVLKVDLSPGAPSPAEALEIISAILERVEAISVGASADHPALYRTAIQLPSQLNRIRHLQLCDGAFYLPPGPPVEICFRKFIAVTELSLCRITFHTAQDMQRLISAMPSVEKLALSDLRWALPDRPLASGLLFHSTPIRLRQLVVHAYGSWIKHCYTGYIFTWLAQSGALVDLNRAFIHVKASSELDLQSMSTLGVLFHGLWSSTPGTSLQLIFVLDIRE
ncbi:uncharacterized protein PHACADRAFT_212727 [Phanerochaete carnosa HHB-10118-sp]|uniref:F-box domain-containing protein n=1 Tax=Phanerochaete carnosa (strain HHB-10118-sp) TaxID=650164 RepID=K5UQN7_PHACS|nr:uncharacterized protein PHACADRAFT_212727 [Phanerochaete carnosa HHB-10118-sp]EKM52146.1 hypothetical protein PHACADRAFT_212727 [Phanerochaete carnosa HHB-10118-sp]